MIRVPGVVEIRFVAAVACCRRTGKLIVGSSGVAILAIERGVPAEKRKPCRLVTLNHVGNFP
jgi:hypothetical protein